MQYLLTIAPSGVPFNRELNKSYIDYIRCVLGLNLMEAYEIFTMIRDQGGSHSAALWYDPSNYNAPEQFKTEIKLVRDEWEQAEYDREQEHERARAHLNKLIEEGAAGNAESAIELAKLLRDEPWLTAGPAMAG